MLGIGTRSILKVKKIINKIRSVEMPESIFLPLADDIHSKTKEQEVASKRDARILELRCLHGYHAIKDGSRHDGHIEQE